jgi:hypothetical protein
VRHPCQFLHALLVAAVFALVLLPPGASAQRLPKGTALCAASSQQIAPAIALDGSGGVVVTWQDYRSGTSDIYALLLNADGTVVTSVGDTPSFEGMSLSPNYPSPFSGRTSMDLVLATEAKVDVEVYDNSGRRVRRIGLFDANEGSHHLTFDGRDDRGRPLTSGVYFYRVRAGGRAFVRKLVIER